MITPAKTLVAGIVIGAATVVGLQVLDEKEMQREVRECRNAVGRDDSIWLRDRIRDNARRSTSSEIIRKARIWREGGGAAAAELPASSERDLSSD